MNTNYFSTDLPALFDDFFLKSSLSENNKPLFSNLDSTYPYSVTEFCSDDNKLESTEIKVALAGFKKSEISVTLIKSNLIIRTKKQEVEEKSSNIKVIHNGIAKRNLDLRFKLSGNCNKKNIDISMENGLLIIKIYIIPDKTFELKIK